MRKVKTYPATIRGRKVRVTIPAREEEELAPYVERAAAFLRRLLDWRDVALEVFVDRAGGLRVSRIWSRLSENPGVGWDRASSEERPLAILLAVEDFIVSRGSWTAQVRIRKLLEAD